MADEYYERYRRVAHEQLYRELHAGSPERLNAMADRWHTIGEALRATAEDLRAQLADLLASWAGETSREYQYRLGLVATWADVLAGEAEATRAALAEMSAALAKAQREAEPEPAGSSEWAHDTVLASALGLAVTEEQRRLSQDRLARVMAELAVEYELADHRAWSPPRVPVPLDLPGALLGSEFVGTQLAGVVATPTTAQTPRLPVGGLPLPATGLDAVGPVAGTAPVRAATTLRGAGSGLASSAAGSAQLAAPRGAEAAGPGGTGAPLPPPVMGAAGGFMPASTTEPVVTGRPAHDDELSWSARDDAAWGDPEDRPPPVLGHPADTA